MALNVETGTGSTTADAFVSLVDWKTYADLFGWDYSGYADALIEAGIVRGTRYVSDNYTYKGTKGTRAQALAWPRCRAYDSEGYYVPSDAVPVEVERATNEAAWREVQDPNSLRPDVTLSERVKSETVGSLSVTYADIPNNSGGSVPKVTIISDILAPLIQGGSGVVTLERA